MSLTNQNVTVMEYTFHVNSSERSSGSNTSFNINFSQVVNLLAKRGQFQIIFNSVQIPFTFYQMNSIDSLNVIKCNFQNLSVTWSVNVTITEGNYTPYTLLTELSRVLTYACKNPPIAYSASAFTPTFQFGYIPATGYMTFAMSSPAGIAITLDFQNSPNINTGGFFGINTLTPTNILITSIVVATDTSTQPCVLNPINYLLVRSSLKQFRNREFIVTKDDVSDILYKVPITTSQSTWINYFQLSEPIYIVDNTIQTINFYLTNNLTYTPINLQKIPWAFSFTLREVLRPDYEALNTFISLIPPIPDNAEEMKRLVDEKEKLLDKLALYRRKLNVPLVKDEQTDEGVSPIRSATLQGDNTTPR